MRLSAFRPISMSKPGWACAGAKRSLTPWAHFSRTSNLGQYGAKLGYYADWLNQGTELGLYFVNYASNLPYVEYQNALPTTLGGTGQNYRLAYPEDIKLYGASFSTTLDWLLNGTAFSGELLYQPNLPFALSAGETLLGRWIDNGVAGP